MHGEFAKVHFLGGCADGEVINVQVWPVLRMAPKDTLRRSEIYPDAIAPVFADTYHVSQIGNTGEFEAICKASGNYT